MSDTVSTERRKHRRTVVGVVTSDKGEKSITVRVDRMVQHPKFKKYVKRSTTYHAHDENNEAHIGDRVSISECKPVSKLKNFRLVSILERSRLRAATEAEAQASEAQEEGE